MSDGLFPGTTLVCAKVRRLMHKSYISIPGMITVDRNDQFFRLVQRGSEEDVLIVIIAWSIVDGINIDGDST